jgi:DNA-binding response OmpR family regulator
LCSDHLLSHGTTTAPAQAPIARRGALFGKRRPVILTVDDNRTLHDVYALAFGQDYDQLRAYDGEQALKILKTKTVDVMVLDLIMPGLHGLKVLERALKLKQRPIAVVCSVINTSQSALRALRLGAADYFVKPTEPEVMEIVVRQLLARHHDPNVAIPQPALVARQVLIIGLDPGFRSALAVGLQPRCRVHVAASISEAIALLGTIMPDLAIVDLRSASIDRVLSIGNLRTKFPEGAIILVGSVERVGRFLHLTAGQPSVVIPEPVDFALLFDEIAGLLPPDPASTEMKSLSAASSKAVGRVVEQYTDHTLRVEHLSVGTGLSIGHFSHIFSEEMGITPMEYVQRVRIQAAIFMLRETRDKVSTIARRFGFYDGPHLALTLRRRGLNRAGDYRRIRSALPE